MQEAEAFVAERARGVFSPFFCLDTQNIKKKLLPLVLILLRSSLFIRGFAALYEMSEKDAKLAKAAKKEAQTLRRMHMFGVCNHSKMTKTTVVGNDKYMTFARFTCPDCTLNCYRQCYKGDDTAQWRPWTPSCAADAAEIEAPQSAVGCGVCVHFDVNMTSVQSFAPMPDNSMQKIEETSFKCDECGFSGCFQYLVK